MNKQVLLYAMGDINDSYILSAQEKLCRPSADQAEAPRKKNVRKASLWLAAAILALLTTLTIAMASNKDFRRSVFVFLGIAETEVVPQHEAPIPVIPEVAPQKSDIGGMIEGTYIHTPVASHAAAGVFLICTDEVEMQQGSHYDAYREVNGELIKLESYPFREALTIGGYTFQTDFEWVDVDGRTIITYCEPSPPYRILSFSGPPESTLITFHGFDRETWETTDFLTLVNLKTGAVTDLLAGLDVPEISNAAISDDQTKILLAAYDGTLYYGDLIGRKLYSIDELSDEHTENCSLIGNTLACWALDGADVERAEYHAWTIDLATMERTDTFRDIPATAATGYDVWSVLFAEGKPTPEALERSLTSESPTPNKAGIQFIAGFGNTFYSGNMFAGSRFAVEVKEDRSVYVIDLLNGETAPIEGFLWPDANYPEVEWVPSPNGEKLLIYGADGSYTGNTFSYMGVLDFTRKVYIQFSRESSVNERSVYWFDNDSIVVYASANEAATDYCIYKLR